MTEELKLMIRLLQPKYIMPIHGEYRMLKRHAQIATLCDVKKENTFVLDNGDILEIDNGEVKRIGSIEVNETYVDGNRIGEVSTAVLNDRKIMASDGILVVIVNINIEEKKLLVKPMITTRGFILINENEELIKKIENMANSIITKKLSSDDVNYQNIKIELSRELTAYIKEVTGRRPLVLPIFMNIKK